MKPALLLAGAISLAGVITVAAGVQDGASPARLRTGGVPVMPSTVVGGGQVIVEATVDRAGRVVRLAPLRVTAPFTALTEAAVREWRFAPAMSAAPGRQPAASKVLVAAMFHAPALTGPTLGEPPRDVAAAPADIPFPRDMPMPLFPPSAAGSGVVLLEARVGADGRVVGMTVEHTAPPFDGAAQAALAQWTFRPARPAGAPAESFVYVLFGFPVVATSNQPRP